MSSRPKQLESRAWKGVCVCVCVWMLVHETICALTCVAAFCPRFTSQPRSFFFFLIFCFYDFSKKKKWKRKSRITRPSHRSRLVYSLAAQGLQPVAAGEVYQWLTNRFMIASFKEVLGAPRRFKVAEGEARMLFNQWWPNLQLSTLMSSLTIASLIFWLKPTSPYETRKKKKTVQLLSLCLSFPRCFFFFLSCSLFLITRSALDKPDLSSRKKVDGKEGKKKGNKKELSRRFTTSNLLASPRAFKWVRRWCFESPLSADVLLPRVLVCSDC